jgi:hypothetical protein
MEMIASMRNCVNVPNCIIIFNMSIIQELPIPLIVIYDHNMFIVLDTGFSGDFGVFHQLNLYENVFLLNFLQVASGGWI